MRENLYSIQLMAVSEPLEDSCFGNLEVSQHPCSDGLYRYSTGFYHTIAEAKRSLMHFRGKGFPYAFIQTREWYDRGAR